jgi:hypothetical protein
MPTPSGLWEFMSPVPEHEIEEAKQALDRALLDEVGLPEDTDIRAMENGLFDIVGMVETIFDDGFKPSRLISSLPLLITKAEELWGGVNGQLSDEIDRKDFIARVIRYAYKKVDPDLPRVSGLVEIMVEDLILGAIPDLVDNLDGIIGRLVDKIKDLFS